MEERIVYYSKQLLLYNDECLNRFMNGMKKEDVLFFEQVKPEFEAITEVARKWKEEAINWVKEKKPKYIHELQIDSTIQNIEQIILQSFYKDTNKQRFTNLHHSVQYVLDSIISETEKSNKVNF
ncbi:DUF1798 family protein [Metabacillus fastidiosus]|uniref:DUF1798 family protein n=1 Tax=Metabacillus fastidiosus TaxID=1458 RepID=UPI002DBF2792|nr:DUF1798 family protein [Metabacillus fastidiosus]MEC2075875.1 DUF1798 family protein [Metabacillus fastidiosus]MED4532147.1 DUF1798 family protein [Metabacillus fastidiosus]